MKISVIIPAYNEERYLADCLESLLSARTAAVAEIFVVDNASTDRTAEIASGFAGVRVLREPRKGTTHARQRGINEARGDVLAFVDADVRVPKGWFERIERVFSAPGAPVALSGPMYYPDASRYTRFMTAAYWYLLAYPAYLAARHMIVGGNFAATRAALLATGGFDPNIDFYGDDTDIARKLKKIGRIRFDLAFKVHGSSRRVKAEGLIRMAVKYAINFLWVSFAGKPFSRTYRDYR